MTISANALHDQQNTASRTLYLDVLRVIACLSVILTHISADFCYSTFGSTPFWIGNVLNTATRTCVPLFVMISGALLLDEGYAFQRSKWLCHIRTLMIFYFVWSAIYCLLFRVLQNLVLNQPLDPKAILSALIQGHAHLWYIPMTCGLYLLLPLLRLWVKRCNQRQVAYFLVLAFLFQSLLPQFLILLQQFIPGFSAPANLVDHFMLYPVLGYVGYFVLGWYLHTYPLPRIRLFAVWGGIAPVILLAENYVLSVSLGYFSSLHGFFNVHVLVMSALVFAVIRQQYRTQPYTDQRIHRIVKLLSRHSLGIYAMHLAVIGVIDLVFDQLPVLLEIPILFFGSLLGSLAGSIILKRIPLLKTIV